MYQDIKIGDTYGQWTILEILPRPSKDKKRSAFACRCRCGATKVVYAPRSGLERCQICKATTNNRHIDLTGRTFGHWTVLGPDRKPGRRKRWLCRCVCGNESAILATSLLHGNSTKCRKCVHEQMRICGALSFQRYFLTKQGAERRGIRFDITRAQLQQLYDEQEGKCAISGVPIVFGNSIREVKAGADTASLDRKDSTKAYTMDNIQWVHRVVNIMKGSLSLDQLVRWCRQIIANQSGDHNNTPPDVGPIVFGRALER